MSFASPLALLGLLLVPVAVAVYLLSQRLRERAAARFAKPALLPNLIDESPRWRRHLPPAILLLAVTMMLVGFAKPHANISVRTDDATAILVIDSSRSMGAPDVKPTRLAAAQASAKLFLKDLPSHFRVAVVAIGSQAQVVAAPTLDREFAAAAIDALKTGEGTAIGDAIASALQVVGVAAANAAQPADATKPKKEPAPAAILVLSDGAADGGRVKPADAITRAKTAKIPVFTALIGTQTGVVEVHRIGGYVERIQVPPDAPLLRRMADQTGGRFFEAPREEDLGAVYADLKSRLSTTRKDTEITVAFAGAAAVFLLFSGALSLHWFRRVP
jgi:Ca-activated chloride channel family protein